ncbi:Hypothetical predicted protein, partial [Paramuricea clavata]
MPDNMALPRCCIHFKDGNGPLTPFTSVSFEKFRHCHEIWIDLDGQQRQVAEKSKGVLQDVDDKSSAVGNFYYHRSCYSKFTNLTNIKRSQARCAKIMANRSVENQQDTISTEPTCSPPPKKMLRSSMPSTSTTSQSSSILPPACIICNKDEIYITDTSDSQSDTSDDEEDDEDEPKQLYDNIDFGEEVKKQTHVTNGIITQKVSHSHQITSERETVNIQKSQRTVQVPEQNIIPFSIGNKKTPRFNIEIEQVTGNVMVQTAASEAAQLLDLTYVLLKMVPSDDLPVLPRWTGFNTLLRKDNIPSISRVGYLPVIDASPTEYSTINTILKRSTKIADQLQLQYATLVFDEAVYAKIQHVRWKNDTYYDRFIDVFIESGIVSEGSIKGVMSGKHYNRSLLCHKTMYEALQRLRFEEFLDTLDDESQEDISSFVETMKKAFEEDQLREYINSEQMEQLCERYEAFIVESSARSLTFAYWSMYIQMTGILLLFIRATREVDWNLHLSSFRSMIPWFFACDKVNYARYGSAYWLEMISLEKSHP